MIMYKLNLPPYKFKVKERKGNRLIFDEIRRKWIKLTPEEWVRQNFAKYLISDVQYPSSLLAIEMPLKLNTMDRRADIVVYNKKKEPKLIVECKAPEIKLNQAVLEQVANYNIVLKVDFLIVTNGIKHYCCKMDYKKNDCKFVTQIPRYSDIVSSR